MKRIILWVALLLVSVSAGAQDKTMQSERRAKAWSFVPEVGVSASWFSDYHTWMKNYRADKTSPRMEWVVGGELIYQSPKSPFGFSFGVLYSQQGIKINGPDEDYFCELDNVNIPFLLHYRFNKFLAFKIGLQPGIDVKHSVFLEEVCNCYEEYHSMSSGDEIGLVNQFSLSVPIGLSFDYHHLVLDLRFNLGVSKWQSGRDSYHRVLQLTAGYRFNF